MNSTIDAVIITSAATLAGLFVYALTQRERLKTGQVWLPVTLLLYVGAILTLLVPNGALPARLQPLTIPLHIAALGAFSIMVATDLARDRVRLFLALAGGWLAVFVLANALFPIDVERGLVNGLLALSLPILVLVLGFAAVNTLLLAVGFYIFYRNPLPELSNRALFWVSNSTLMLAGFSLSISGNIALMLLGVIASTTGMIVAAYSQITYRVFDIRNLLGLAFRVLLLITITSVGIFGALVILDNIDVDNPATRTVFAMVVALVIAIMYTPVRELANFLINRLLVGDATDAVDATRRYSQELSKAVEIDELVDLSSSTLNQVLHVRRSGMLLVSDSRETGLELVVMRGGSLAQTKNRRVFVPADSEIYKQAVLQQRPVTQFDIIFNPLYDNLPDELRTFFKELDMSAYAPIVMDGAIIGLLACGSKLNGTPLYQHDLDLLAALANQTGVALRNTRLVADLRHLNTSMQTLNRNLGDANNRMGKLDSVKTDFVTIASHELRTPLAQVRGYTDIIDALNDQGMLEPDQTRGLVNNLRKATERMEELIAAMLDVSQLDVNAMDLRFTQSTPESVLRMAIEPLTDPIKQRKLTLSARGLRGLPAIEADMQRLVQAFRNVITNAIKYTPDGGRIDITAKYHEAKNERDENHILIAITDTGIGIDRAHHELIFDKFYRVSDPGLHSTGTYKFMGAGPGLGLTIARGVIEGHGGAVWAESPGHDPKLLPGSTFYVRLPLTPPETASRVLPFEAKSENNAETNPRPIKRLNAGAETQTQTAEVVSQ